MKKYLISIASVLFFVPIVIFAHQPNFVNKQTEIVNGEPDISKAYYGELSGEKVVYKIYATSSLKLYVQILSPKIENSSKDFVVLITDDEQNVVANLSTSTDKWQSWYEDYGGDWYWQGPSFKGVVRPGKYDITVSNLNNLGRYSLAIGEVESFPAEQFFHTIKELFLIKTKFFNEPWYGIFYGIIGKYLFVSLFILLIILFISIYIGVRLFRKMVIKRRIV